jgi:hypothetical protein
MADPRTETDTEPDLSPDEAAQLLESARRAQEDIAAGRVYRTSEEGLRAVLRHAERLRRGEADGPNGRPRPPLGVDEAVREAIEAGLQKRLLERA